MAAGKLRAVVCTSTLDLGIDWGDVDLVIHIGAPKGASRLAQRIGRANHRLDEPSKAILVPANRFEVLECRAALDANYLGAQDTPPIRDGAPRRARPAHPRHGLLGAVLGRRALSRGRLGLSLSRPRRARPSIASSSSSRPAAMRSGPTSAIAKIRQGADGLWRITHPRVAQQYRLNVGTIIEAPLLNVRVGADGARRLCRTRRPGARQDRGIFRRALSPGDTFLFAGHDPPLRGHPRKRGDRHAHAPTTRRRSRSTRAASSRSPPISPPACAPCSPTRNRGRGCPTQVSDWLRMQKKRSVLPKRDQLLVETFPRGSRFYMVAYPFEGRLAHQTLGMLLTRRLERARLRPTGFVATDYSLAVWGLGDLGRAFAAGEPSLAELFDEDMLGDDLEAWMADSYLLKRTFRNGGADLRADREAPPRPGKERPAGDGVDRPHLRRAPPPRARPHSAAGDLGGRRERASRHRPAWRYAVANQGANRASDDSIASRRWRSR